MIIKGKSRGLPQNLGTYLTANEENERAEVVEVRGTIAQDVPGALKEMDALASGTKCELPLYHAQISPEPPYRLDEAQRNASVDALEKRLGFEGHQRVVVVHEKLDREHIHVVWGRVNPDTLQVVSMSFNYRKNEEVARELERQFGHPRVQGAHAERDGVERPDRSPSRSELRQEERTGISSKFVKADVTRIFQASENAHAFKTALEDQSYLLAKGDRRDFVVVDHAGGIHSLARRIDGMRADELREFMKPIDRDTLSSASVARDAQIDRAEGRRSAFDERVWEDKLRDSAIAKDKVARDADREDTKRFRAEAIKWEANQKQLRDQRKASRAQAKRERKYSKGDGYANQSRSALDDHLRRQRALDKAPKPKHPSDHRAPTIQNDFRDTGQASGGQSPDRPAGQSPDSFVDRSHGPTADGPNYNKAADKQYEAMRKALYGEEGFEKSHVADEARLRHEEDQERKREKSKPSPGEKPLNEKQKGRSIWESDEEPKSRMQRLLNEEKWEPRFDDEDLAPDRQREAPGGGRTRSR